MVIRTPLGHGVHPPAACQLRGYPVFGAEHIVSLFQASVLRARASSVECVCLVAYAREHCPLAAWSGPRGSCGTPDPVMLPVLLHHKKQLRLHLSLFFYPPFSYFPPSLSYLLRSTPVISWLYFLRILLAFLLACLPACLRPACVPPLIIHFHTALPPAVAKIDFINEWYWRWRWC